MASDDNKSTRTNARRDKRTIPTRTVLRKMRALAKKREEWYGEEWCTKAENYLEQYLKLTFPIQDAECGCCETWKPGSRGERFPWQKGFPDSVPVTKVKSLLKDAAYDGYLGGTGGEELIAKWIEDNASDASA